MFPVTGGTRQGFPKRKGPKVELGPATVGLATGSAPPFNLYGKRDKHPKGKHHSAQRPFSNSLGFSQNKQLGIRVHIGLDSYADFRSDEKVLRAQKRFT